MEIVSEHKTKFNTLVGSFMSFVTSYASSMVYVLNESILQI